MAAQLVDYLGAKRSLGTLYQIIGQMPQHDIYVEMYLGTGAVLHAKPPVEESYGIEIDASTLASFDHSSAGAKIIAGDCLDFIRGFRKTNRRVFVYADPPYVWSTRTSKARYRHEYADDDHRSMVKALDASGFDYMISGYHSALYDEILPNARRHEFQAMTRGGVRTEVLFMNYAPPKPFWHTQAGKNAEDRRRIKRLCERHVAAMLKRPPLERMALLHALCSAGEVDHGGV